MTTKRGRKPFYPLYQMEVGDYFEVPTVGYEIVSGTRRDIASNRVGVAVAAFKKKNLGCNFKTRKVGSIVRCVRVA